MWRLALRVFFTIIPYRFIYLFIIFSFLPAAKTKFRSTFSICLPSPRAFYTKDLESRLRDFLCDASYRAIHITSSSYTFPVVSIARIMFLALLSCFFFSRHYVVGFAFENKKKKNNRFPIRKSRACTPSTSTYSPKHQPA